MKTELMEQDFELLSAYHDGELGADDTRALRARLLAEPALRAAYDQLKSADNRLRNDLRVSGAQDVPFQITQLVQAAETRPDAGWKRSAWGFGLAASVLVAAAMVLNIGVQTGGGTQFAAPDALVSPVLEDAVSRGEGWEVLADGTRVRPLLSFATVEGDWCREYLLAHGESEWRGVACRSSGQGEGLWETAVLAAEEYSKAVNGYRPAGTMSPDEVVSFIDSRSADIPLSREQEAELIARGWK